MAVLEAVEYSQELVVLVIRHQLVHHKEAMVEMAAVLAQTTGQVVVVAHQQLVQTEQELLAVTEGTELHPLYQAHR
jgi:hypothetical protein